MNVWEKYFLICSGFTVLIPVSITIVRLNMMVWKWRFLAILIFIDFLAEVIGHILYFLKISNHFLWPVFIPVEFCLILWIYKSELDIMGIGRTVPLLTILFPVYVLVDWIFSKTGGLSAIPHFIEGILILCLVMCFYVNCMRSDMELHIERQAMFWLSTGLCIYFAANSVIFLFSNYIQSFSLHFFNQVWFIHAVFNILLYLFYSLTVCLIPGKLNYIS
jgi:hypothetical protein